MIDELSDHLIKGGLVFNIIMEGMMSNVFDEISTKIETEPLTFVFSEQIARTMENHFSVRDIHRGLHNCEELREPEKAYEVISKFMDKCEALKGPEDYKKQAISSDLARACSYIPVETPEMAAKLIKTTSDLFEMKSYGGVAKFQLDTFAKQGRFLGDKKVAEAYLDATSKSFSKLDTTYDSCVSALEKYKSIVADHPEMAAKVLDTVSMLQDRFADNPYWKETTNDILKAIADNPRIDTNTRNSSKDRLPNLETPQPIAHNGLQMARTEPKSNKSENKTPSRPSVKDKAKDFIKTSKSYAAGKKLFSKLNENLETIVKENPKMCTAGGAVAMFAGISSMNPQLAAAGAIVMAAGIKAWSDKLKNMRGLGKSNNSTKIQPSKPLTLNNAVHKSLTSRGVR